MNQRGEQRWHQLGYQLRAIEKAKRIGIASGLNTLDAHSVATVVVEYLVSSWRQRPMSMQGIRGWRGERHAFEYAFATTARRMLRSTIDERLKQRRREREKRTERRQRLTELLGVRP